MIYARAQARPGRLKFATVGLTVNISGEHVPVNATAFGRLADALLRLEVGDRIELAGPIHPRASIDERGTLFATFDIETREISKPHAFKAAPQPVPEESLSRVL